MLSTALPIQSYLRSIRRQRGLIFRVSPTSVSSMEIDSDLKVATISVGEFARFSPFTQRSDPLGFGNWRAAAGQQWHKEIQNRADSEGFSNEQSIKGDLEWRGWTFRLNGRIDQIRSQKDRTHLREIKTVTTPLPLRPEEVSSRFKSYCIQLLTYRELLNRIEAQPTGSVDLDLFLIELGSGITQSLLLDERFDTLVVDQLDVLADYLDRKLERLSRLRALRFKPAYETPRPGQETIQEDLNQAFERSPIGCLEAPTGYGKTGVAWEFALNRLATGKVERIVYLTSKSTGQIEAAERLDALLTDQSAASYWQIRNKAEHCVNVEFRCSNKTCSYLSDLEEKWGRSALEPMFLSTAKPISIDALKETSAAAGICPYETMRTALGYRDIWIGDYNYLFSANSSRLLADQPDFDPARTFLIIDEAHNLPSRIESNLSKELSALSLNGLIEELSEIGVGHKIHKSLTNLVNECLAYRKGDVLTLRQLDDLTDLLLELINLISTDPMPYESITPEALDTLWSLSSGSTALKESASRYIAWIPQNGLIRITCIDPSQEIRETLTQFKECLMLSATFQPIDGFLEQCGLADQLTPPQQIAPRAPWLEGAYNIAIDTRTDTRFKSRKNGEALTAATIAKLAERHSPIVVFFPSYAYAQSLYEAIAIDYPFYRIAMQRRGKGESLSSRAEFIDEAMRFHDIIFLTLGSSFAEGIDMIGGKIDAAIVVSPALPEVNAIQQAKRDYYQSKKLDGFERAYLQPGIQKVNQALGRLVRAPGQKVKVLLHCQRYAERRTKSLLADQYQNCQYIFKDEDLERWIEEEPILKT